MNEWYQCLSMCQMTLKKETIIQWDNAKHSKAAVV